MVGTRRSVGCAICRQRHKKCDEGKPQCRACIASGWECPGYSRTWRFISLNSKLERYYQGRRYLLDTDSNDTGSWDSHDSISQGLGFLSLTLNLIQNPQPSAAESLSGALIQILLDARCHLILSTQLSSVLLPLIPSRLGYNAALDSAVRCLCLAYNDVIANRIPSATTTRGYVSALGVLRRYILNPSLQTQSETLCASIIVQTCELILEQDVRNYDALLRGTRVLVQAAGPGRFCRGFENTLLEFLRAPFAAQDFADEEPCFLEGPEWRLVAKSLHSSQSPALLSMKLRFQLNNFLVQVPGLLYKARVLLENSTVFDHDNSLKNLSIVIQNLLCRIELWYHRDVVPHIRVKDSSKGAGERTSREHDYPDPLFAVLDCVACSLLVKLAEMEAHLANKLCKTGLGRLASACGEIQVQKYLVAANSARSFVRAHSGTMAKQLAFGQGKLDVRSELLFN